MKKIAGKIAMILVVIMLANAYSGCTLINLWMLADGNGMSEGWWWITGIIIDLIALAVVGLYGLSVNDDAAPDQGVYLAGFSDPSFEAESAALRETFAALPKEETAALTRTIISLPRNDYNSLTETVNSMSKEEITASMKRINAASQEELVSSIQKINSLSEKELAALIEEMRHLRAMPKAKVASATKTANSLPKTEYFAVADYSREKPFMELCFQY